MIIPVPFATLYHFYNMRKIITKKGVGIIAFLVLLFIFWAGYIQSWAFSDRDILFGERPPWGYGLLNKIGPFWVIQVLLGTPLWFLIGQLSLMDILATDNIDSFIFGSFGYWILVMIYCWLLSQISIKLIRIKETKKKILAIAVFIGFFFILPWLSRLWPEKW